MRRSSSSGGSSRSLAAVRGTNFCDIAVESEGERVVVASAIDNLVKGASGQAIQNMNLMCGFPEQEGLKGAASCPRIGHEGQRLRNDSGSRRDSGERNWTGGRRGLRKHLVGGPPVMDGEKLAGIITESDILRLLKTPGISEDLWLPSPLEIIEVPIREAINWAHTQKALSHIGDQPVLSVMSSPAITIGEDEDMDAAAALMVKKRIGRLPVVRGRSSSALSHGRISSGASASHTSPGRAARGHREEHLRRGRSHRSRDEGREERPRPCRRERDGSRGLHLQPGEGRPPYPHAKRIARGELDGIIVNSGCANAYTGKKGIRDAARMSEIGAGVFRTDPNRIGVASTGIIGRYLDLDLIGRQAELVAPRMRQDPAAEEEVARAIMTTDLVEKHALVRGNGFSVGGICKGSGMIAPNMGTMIALLYTDAEVTAGGLQRALRLAARRSFNRVVVDGDTSTNDIAICTATGDAGRVLAGSIQVGPGGVRPLPCDPDCTGRRGGDESSSRWWSAGHGQRRGLPTSQRP